MASCITLKLQSVILYIREATNWHPVHIPELQTGILYTNRHCIYEATNWHHVYP
jgi:hypothetical protein